MSDLWLDGWGVLDRAETSLERIVTAEYAAVPEACPKCGVVGRLYKHGERTIDYRDAPAFGKRLVIRAKVKRFRCRECNAVSNQSLPDMQPGRQLTRRCADHLVTQCRTRNYAEMSRETGVDESVIRALCNEAYEGMKAFRRPIAPVVLGIDELTLGRKRRCILVDIQTGAILDLLEGISKAQVAHWLTHMQQRERCKVVTMDMWKDYLSAVHGVLPGATVVIDKWHVQKAANDALDRIRNRHRRGQATKAGRKNPWRVKRVLMARRHNLKPKSALLLDGILKNTPLIADAYTAKERFYEIWDAPTREAAEAAFAEWKAALPASVSTEFSKVAQTIENWRTPIFAYWDHRFTNALTEAVNGLIKAVNRDGRGYKFEHIRAKVLSAQKELVAKPPPITPEESAMTETVCECCLGHFDVPLLEVHHIRPFGTGKAKSVRMCPNCHRRFHLEGVYAAHCDSTLKNG